MLYQLITGVSMLPSIDAALLAAALKLRKESELNDVREQPTRVSHYCKIGGYDKRYCRRILLKVTGQYLQKLWSLYQFLSDSC